MSALSTDRVLRPDNGQRNELANALRALAMNAVQQAASGHPGAPMGMADMAVALWQGHLQHNPANPMWPARDRSIAARWIAREAGAKREADWQQRFAACRAEHPALVAKFERRMAGELPRDFAVRGGEKGGRHINYGVREFGMAALMKLRVIHVFTHDSIGLVEDGPTHQAVEQAASLRLIPNLEVWRPCDAAETAVAWTQAVQSAERPSALLLTRQNLPAQTRSPEQVAAIGRVSYVLSDRPDAIAAILATGSEVGHAMAAQRLLDQRGRPVRVVSIPSSTRFDRQDRAWRDAVLGAGLVRVGVEAGVTRWWGQYGCLAALGVDSFGESAPAAAVHEHFGLTAQHLAKRVEQQLAAAGRVASPVH